MPCRPRKFTHDHASEQNRHHIPHHRRLRFRLRRPHRAARAHRPGCPARASPFSATRRACPTAPSRAAPSPATPLESAQFLVREQGAEFLVIACNTASALALDAIQDAVPVPVLGVIEPGAAAARAASRTGDVLVIATDATVHSHAYAAACQRSRPARPRKGLPAAGAAGRRGLDRPSGHRRGHPHLSQRACTPKPPPTACNPTRWCSAARTIRCCGRYRARRAAGMRVIDSAESAADAAVHLFNGAARDAAGSPSVGRRHGNPLLCHRFRGEVRAPRLPLPWPPGGQVELVDLGG